MREIVLDTETTGLDPDAGHRIVEIACLELINHLPTGRDFQVYVNPERDMPQDAFAVHGLSEAFLADKPVFAEIATSLLEFIGDAPLVIHNAEFDLRFLDAELSRCARRAFHRERDVIDTLSIARRRFPGAQASLDALCRRFAIDNSARTRHGALLDAELLAAVYLELIGGRQPDLALAQEALAAGIVLGQTRPLRPARPHEPTAAEAALHQALLAKLVAPIWQS